MRDIWRPPTSALFIALMINGTGRRPFVADSATTTPTPNTSVSVLQKDEADSRTRISETLITAAFRAALHCRTRTPG